MDLLDFEPAPGTEDVIANLLDPMDLLEGIELGEFDFPTTCFEQGPENSDSDSGISVSCENVLLGRTHAPNTSTTTIPKSTPVTPDLVLTDAVYSSFPSSSVSEQTVVSGAPSMQPSLPQNGASAKPVRIFKLCSSSSGRPAFITPIDSTLQGSNCRPSLNRITSVPNPTPCVTTPTSMFGHSVILHTKNPTLIDSVTTKDTTKVTSSPYVRALKPDPELSTTGEFFPTVTQPDFSSFLDDYDSTLYPDMALEEHLREFYGHSSSPSISSTLGSHNNGFPLGSATPPFIPSPELLSSGDCLLTHASLQRLRKKQERMIKNRYAASMSRLRKKEYLERLEMRYEQLKRENVNLWRQNEEWRVRCNELERSLTELQSQLNGYDCGDQHLDDALPSDSSSAPSTPPVQTLQTISSTGSLRQTSTLSLPTSSSVFSASSNTALSNPTRSSLATLSLQTPRSTGQPSMKWVSNLESTQSPGLEKRSGILGNRKTVANNVFYSGKGSFLSKSDGPLPAKLHRPSLLNLTGVISRNSTGSRLQSNRTKLVATTSLLSILCLFSLNMVLSPLSWGTARTGVSNIHVQYDETWSAPHYSPGQRLLLSLPESISSHPSNSPIEENHETETNGSRCNPVDSRRADSDRIWQLWIEQNKMHQPNRSREPLPWSSGRLRYTAQSWRGRNKVLTEHKLMRPSPTNRDLNETSGDTASHPVRQDDKRSSASVERVADSSKPMAVNMPAFDESRSGSRRLLPVHRPSKVVSQRGLQPFYRRFVWYQEDLLEAAGRRNDTVYFILSKIDAVHVFDPVGDSPARKITLIVPAYPSPNASNFNTPPNNESHAHLIMLQVDCDLRNVTFIHPPGKPVEPPRN